MQKYATTTHEDLRDISSYVAKIFLWCCNSLFFLNNRMSPQREREMRENTVMVADCKRECIAYLLTRWSVRGYKVSLVSRVQGVVGGLIDTTLASGSAGRTLREPCTFCFCSYRHVCFGGLGTPSQRVHYFVVEVYLILFSFMFFVLISY